MPDYKNAKIYKLWSPEGDDIYIGSTTQSLCQRKAKHKFSKDCSSKILFEKYEEVIIELIEYFPCNNKEELNKKEGMHIRMNDCVNKQIAGRTDKEWREDNPEYNNKYYEDNPEYFKEKGKKYRENNVDKIKELKKKYNKENADKIKDYNKKYKEQNRDKIKEKTTAYKEQNRDIINEKQRAKRKEKKNE